MPARAAADPGTGPVRDAATYFGRGRCCAHRHVPARVALVVLGTALALASVAPLVPPAEGDRLVAQLCGASPAVCGLRLAAGIGVAACTAAPEFTWMRGAVLAMGMLFGALALLGGAGIGSILGGAGPIQAMTGLHGIACVLAMSAWALTVTDPGMETAWLTGR